MKAEDLRLNNIVKVHWEDEHRWCALDFWEGVEFEPIQLTEEWLTRFGFDSGTGRGRSKNFYYHNASPFRVEMFEEHILFKEHGNPRELRAIKYVHQLQNLYFALTGEELTIKE